MRILKSLFNGKKENPFFTIFKKTFPKGNDFNGFKVYHIKSFQYTDSNMELFERGKYKEDFHKILDSLEYNSLTNNVAIYYVVSPEGKGMVYLLSDPFELLEKEYVMEKYELNLDEKVMNLSTVEQIN